MTLDAGVLQSLTKGTPEQAWRIIIEKAVEIASRPLAAGNAPSEVTKRDREIGALDHFLSSSGWDLWQAFGEPEISGVERTSDRLAYAGGPSPNSAKAVLVLDGLSLRELPWLLEGAKERGFTLHEVTANASELPGETNEFAQALALAAAVNLQNNGGGLAHKLQPTQTECVDYAVEGLRGADQCLAELGVLAPLARQQAARWLWRWPGPRHADPRRSRTAGQRRLLGFC
jgi:hypothetical protein